MNYIAFKPEIDLSDSVSQHLHKDMAPLDRQKIGTLIVYESNFTPMWARAAEENCTRDLEMEIAVQRFLGTLPVDSFYIQRAGNQCDYRGASTDHPFAQDEDVIQIEADFLTDLS